ncbi:hypothetical protein R1flu_027104 [Riccia fluitans]|uniref:Squalene cyclase C-terminal domain-containing protein n=1 Tax=Riccia fluitans TaxID=41844 RepID=A0ABD1XKW9_9MARC
MEKLKECQNDFGEWGEGLESYRDKSTMGKGIESTAFQAVWALMGLLAHLTAEDLVIRRGVTWLVQISDRPRSLSTLTKVESGSQLTTEQERLGEKSIHRNRISQQFLY